MSAGIVRLPERIRIREIELASRSRDANDRRSVVHQTQGSAEVMLRRLGYRWGGELPLRSFRAALELAGKEKGFVVPPYFGAVLDIRNEAMHEMRAVSESDAVFVFTFYRGILAGLARHAQVGPDELVLQETERNYRVVIEPNAAGVLQVIEPVSAHPQRVLGYWKGAFSGRPVDGVFLPRTVYDVSIVSEIGTPPKTAHGVELQGAAKVWVSGDGIHVEFNTGELRERSQRAWSWWCTLISFSGRLALGISGFVIGVPLAPIVIKQAIAMGLDVHGYHYPLAALLWILLVAFGVDFRGFAGSLRPGLRETLRRFEKSGPRMVNLIPWSDVSVFRHEPELLVIEGQRGRIIVGLVH